MDVLQNMITMLFQFLIGDGTPNLSILLNLDFFSCNEVISNRMDFMVFL